MAAPDEQVNPLPCSPSPSRAGSGAPSVCFTTADLGNLLQLQQHCGQLESTVQRLLQQLEEVSEARDKEALELATLRRELRLRGHHAGHHPAGGADSGPGSRSGSGSGPGSGNGDSPQPGKCCSAPHLCPLRDGRNHLNFSGFYPTLLRHQRTPSSLEPHKSSS